MMTLRHLTAAEVRHQQEREREREREIKRERERQKSQTDREQKRERERGIFPMMGFDYATSSFLALLVNKSYRKNKESKIKKKASNSQ